MNIQKTKEYSTSNKADSSGEIFRKNISLLKKRFYKIYKGFQREKFNLLDNVRYFMTDQGHPNISFAFENGVEVPFYDNEDIIGWCEDLISGWNLETEDSLFFVGFGLGYIPLASVNRFSASPHIVIMEPNEEVFYAALRIMDLEPLLLYKHLHLYIGRDCDAAKVIRDFNFQIFLGKQRMVTHRPSRIIFGDSIKELEEELKSRIGLTRDLWKTAKDLGGDMFSNTISNLPGLIYGVDLGKMKNRFSGLPAICVAAGPSLDRVIDKLKEVKNRAILIAMDSSVSLLAAAGINPHMVVTCDTKKINFEKLRPYLDNLRESILIFAVESNPDNVRAFLGHRRIAVSVDNPILKDWLGPLFNLDCTLKAMTTVSHAAIFTALELGADPIVLVGMDMAFDGYKSHARGALHHYHLSSDKLIETEGTNGLPVLTYGPLNDYRKQIEDIISKTDVRFINTCLAGALIHGAEIKSLEEVLETKFSSSVEVTHVLDNIKWDFPVQEKRVAKELETMLKKADEFQAGCKLGLNMAKNATAYMNRENTGNKTLFKIRMLKEYDKSFRKKHKMIVHLLEVIRLADVQKAAISQMRLNNRKASNLTRLQREINNIEDTFRSCMEAAGYFAGLIKDSWDMFNRIVELKESILHNPHDLSIQLSLARFFAETREVMPAEGEYKKYIKHYPGCVQPWIELSELYLSFNMFAPVVNLIREISELFPDDRRVDHLKIRVKEKIDSLLNKAYEAWGKKDIFNARKYLLEYLSLCPEDRVAKKLEEDLSKTDTIKRSELLETEEGEHEDFIAEKLLAKARVFAKNNETERVVGILEGLIKNCHSQNAYYREKIGDIRFFQQDFISAVWHYAQAYKLEDNRHKLQQKMEKARRLAESFFKK